ncbi:uncharacterized protein BX664DRAFT_319048 [Halteromyces radiatus]|uniref:uncharacterized protein n=1 Tax=Halteromyces radiatus TaxID=101107 RepID=UPI0022204C14|nr:uncharacterized protein BX664DRAFT_319048 [Halteromyces radiatus]KAI8098570.1 hypothetical protein BX664DRAFT_319048 [Halteromyces radiatus]
MEPTQGNVSHSMIVSITTPTTSTKDSVTAATAATAAVVETERAITTTAQLCKDDDMMVRSTMVSSTYTCFFITLDLVCMTGNDMMKSGRKPWTKETWPFLVAWKEQQQKHYEQLLQWLHPWIDKGYQVELINDSHLRLYFPTATTRQQALVWLDEFKHKLIMEYGGCPDWQLEEETVLIQEPLLPVGPDYFQGIHLFLTHIDELVENGPGFTKFGFVDGT